MNISQMSTILTYEVVGRLLDTAIVQEIGGDTLKLSEHTADEHGGENQHGGQVHCHNGLKKEILKYNIIIIKTQILLLLTLK